MHALTNLFIQSVVLVGFLWPKAKEIKKIGVLTSGGDAPGMNAAIRAVVRSSFYYGIEAVGIYRGYEGMIDGDFETLDVRSVNHILGKGGTVLKSARCLDFHQPEIRAKAAEKLSESNKTRLLRHPPLRNLRSSPHTMDLASRM